MALVDDSEGDGSCNDGFAGALGILDEGEATMMTRKTYECAKLFRER